MDLKFDFYKSGFCSETYATPGHQIIIYFYNFQNDPQDNTQNIAIGKKLSGDSKRALGIEFEAYNMFDVANLEKNSKFETINFLNCTDEELEDSVDNIYVVPKDTNIITLESFGSKPLNIEDYRVKLDSSTAETEEDFGRDGADLPDSITLTYEDVCKQIIDLINELNLHKHFFEDLIKDSLTAIFNDPEHLNSLKRFYETM